ncbi:PREDICTED: phospholipid scramblase 1-like isoform X1 [Trachymyrmex septentrionalis]|uniref:phospholipid scramblase 1-like isoform X1 n=1 Tax=Trachymyrmex septentrionalis TaxID=34720 RepID=UPI00084F20C5|nr:PREDICTED: phospholipid scramblase 1-like isoform X1 [Trachymyrmex septentrionalis]XP_018339128.1 PREDICTED: phospholipid scramblase 1-like isoform X1 [Trachymyrmex septentrionalis]
MMRYTEADPMAERSYAQQLNDTSTNNGEQQSQATATNAATQTMELQENAPIIHANPTIITVQPGEGESRFRRPIPISTLDWISTPRSHLNAITGTQFLDGVEQLEIQQVIDLSTLLGRLDKGIQYRVKVPRAETLFLAMESKMETESRLCGWYKGFVLNVLDQCGETAFIIRKDPSLLHVPCSRQRITVESANIIGSVEKNFSPIGPSFTVYNAIQEPLCNIYGPFTCDCCMFKEAQFQIVSLDGSHQVASLIHQWDHFAVDYILLLTFPVDTDVRLKSLLLGASFLIEYLYFHRIRRASRR